MKKIIKSGNVGILVIFAFILMFSGLINFASAYNAYSTEDSSVGGLFDKDHRFDQDHKKGKGREETEKTIGRKEDGNENKTLKMKENKGRLESKFEKKKSRLATSTFEYEISKASTSAFIRREKGSEKIKEQNENILKHFEKNINRLEDFYRKILKKAGKFEKKGVNVSEARALLDIAKSKIEIAKSDVSSLGKVVSDGIIGQNEKDYFALIKNLSVKAMGSIKDAREALSKAVSSLKPGLNKNSSSSASSVSSRAAANASSSVISSSASSSSSNL
ncbi:MAG: hypothetical protein KGJ58_00420 [Patescibacteria group bacterium]|nr:hypothetical protein [Patescibacteria group bacterium]MDE1988708.1 hypothetical protein [Patescibacteria group bacterium]MDE2217906.1 hypothetical protein [Patescibacteria group bacterium]